MPAFFKPHHFLVVYTSARRIDRASTSSAVGDFDDYAVCRASGIFLHENFQFSGDYTSNWNWRTSLKDAADAMGEWSLIAKRHAGGGEEYVSLSDPYGYAPVFYAFIPGRYIVLSDSFGGVSAGLESLGLTPTLDIANFALVMPNWVGGFLGPFSDRTMANEIQVLSAEECLYISEEHVLTLNRSSVGKSAEVGSYSEALDRAISYSINVLDALSKNESLDRRIRLSGGGDSRMVLSMLVSAGIHGRFKVQATDPRNFTGYSAKVFGRDIEISNTLRKKFAMQWAEKEAILSFELDFKEALSHYLGYRSNFGQDFYPARHRALPETPLLTLIGGGGEIIRASKGAREYAVQSGRGSNMPAVGSAEEDRIVAEWLIEKLAVIDPLKGTVRDLIESSFSRTLGGTRWERFNHNYFLARNRTHFGHARYSESENTVVCHPLSNAYFLKAASISSFEFRAGEGIMRDLFDRTVPDLARIEFADPLVTSAACPSEVERVPLSDSWQDSFDRALIRQPPRRRMPAFERRQNASLSFDPMQSSINYLRLALGELDSRAASDDAEHVFQQGERLVAAARSGKLKSTELAGKAASALELFQPTGSSCSRIDLFCSAVRGASIGIASTVTVPSTRNDGWNNVSVIELHPKLKSSGLALIADLAPVNLGSVDYEFACYLQRGGATIQRLPYQAGCVFIINGPMPPGEYSIIGFARRKGGRNPVAQVDSSRISLEAG